MRNSPLRFLPILLVACNATNAQSYSITTVAGGSPPTTPAPARNVSFSANGVAVDSAGNTYFTALNSIFKVDSGGILTLLAGNSRPGFAGDGGPVSAEQFNVPFGLAFDSTGNLYVADRSNHRVRKIASDGKISTIAGSGAAGSAGDGGPATRAMLNQPTAIAIDSAGAVYIADGNGVHKVVSGTITTAAKVPADGVTVDASGNLYVSGGQKVYKLDTLGNLTTFATITTLYGCEGSPFPNFPDLLGLVADGSGNLYVGDFDGFVYKVAFDGSFQTIAGTGYCKGSSGGDGGPATSAPIGVPYGLSLNRSGDLFVGAFGVRKISGGIISTIAGNPQTPVTGDGGPATQAVLSGAMSLASDVNGNIFISDLPGNRIRKISAKDGTIQVFAGTGTAGYSGDSGPALSAQLNGPQGMALDAAGNLYVADTGNQRVRRISAGGTITTAAGTGVQGFSGYGGPATDAQLFNPSGVAFDGAGNLFIVDGASSVLKVGLDGKINMLAGSPPNSQGPIAFTVRNIAVDPQGNVIFADQIDNRLGKIAPGGTVTYIAGTGHASVRAGTGDGGPAINAELNYPMGVAVDGAGNIFFTDSGNNQIRRVSPDGTITTIAGNGLPGYFGDGSLAINAELNDPASIALDPAGNIYVADAGNYAVRRLSLAASLPPPSVGVTNGFSNLRGPIAPGEMVVIYGSGLGPDVLVHAQPQNGAFGTQVGGVQVLVNGISAPMIYAWSKQVAAVIPFETPIGGEARVQVQYLGQIVFDQTTAVAATSPGIATADASGIGQAAAINQDGTANGPGNPAKPGSAITLFWTGGGEMFPNLSNGQITATGVLNLTGMPLTATIGGLSANVEYSGIAPTFVAGLLQVNLRIPANAKAGSAVPVIVSQGNGQTPSQAVTVAISGN